MRIVQFTAENVKRLSAVSITPDGNLVVIGGKNAQGKTSVLDAIAMALGGKDLVCAKPLREGAKKGFSEVTISEPAAEGQEAPVLKVKRTFTEGGGGTLTITNAEGAVYKSPQAILDKLNGRLTFDPLAFCRMDPKKQADTLRALVGLDFSALDAKRAGVFAERTNVNREKARFDTLLASSPHYPNVPAEEETMADLAAELQRRQAVNRERDAIEDAANDAEEAVSRASADLAALQARMQALIKEMGELRTKIVAATANVEAKQQAAQEAAAKATAQREDEQEVIARMQSVETVNRQVRANKTRAANAEELKKVSARADALTRELDRIDLEKQQALEDAKFPVDGLSFDEDGVTFNGVPLAQASGAEQIRVSVAIGIAMNPKLRVLLIRDGSLLDQESMLIVEQMAEENDMQVWMERVGTGAEVSVVIEDGTVRGEATRG
jgi:DNA repair exonuclease SbcCD ATPase subunit